MSVSSDRLLTPHAVLRFIPAAMALGSVLVLAACSSPARRFSDHAAARTISTELVTGASFEHVVFWSVRPLSRTLHVYLDGDGTPSRAGVPADDPTPRDPLVLELMVLDPNLSVYLGRPCYHGLSRTPGCAGTLWTDARYSERVVSSMAAALRRILERDGFERVRWFGYSGGGTLAVLLAPRFDETVSVVTVAANLDVDAWADLHSFPRLRESLNPARQPLLPRRIHERHYVGGRDRLVTREIVAHGPVDRTAVVVIPTYDHACCWMEIWRAVLREVEDSDRATRRRSGAPQ